MSITNARATFNQSFGSLELQVLFDRGISNRHVNQGSILKQRDQTPKQIVNPNSSFARVWPHNFAMLLCQRWKGFRPRVEPYALRRLVRATRRH